MSVYGIELLELHQHPQVDTTLRITYRGKTLDCLQIATLLDSCSHICSTEGEIKNLVLSVEKNPSYILIDASCHSKEHLNKILQQKNEHETALKNKLHKKSLESAYPVEVSQEKSWDSLKEFLIHIAPRISPFPLSEILEEALRIFLATDIEFKKIRSVPFLARLILSHLVLRKSLPSLSSRMEPAKLKIRVWNSTLSFPFGEQKIVSLAISLSSLSSYEQFELQHILHACKRVLPSIRPVPNSYYFYKHPRDLSWNFHVELGKENNGVLQSNEIALFKKNLAYELASSIEQVMNTIEIPYNEEETLRSIRVLSHELNTKNPLPQVLIQFQRQKASFIAFDLYLLKLVKETDLFPLSEEQKTITSGSVTMKLQRQEIVGRLRNNKVKLLQLYEASCDKKPLIRHDYSINFIKAREQVLEAICSHIGPVRDVNGGFLSEQKNFILSLKYSLVSPLFEKEEPLLEQLIRNVKPNLGKSTLEQPSLFILANLLLQFHKEKTSSSLEPIRFKQTADTLALVIQRPSNLPEENLLKSPLQALVASFLTHEGVSYACLAFHLSQPEVASRLLNWYRDLVHSYSLKMKQQQGIRISLPRPIRLLDPRTGSDKTSGIVIKMLYEGLMSHDLNGTLIHAIANSYTVSSDQTQYTFFLREAYWSNGQKITAFDFEYAWKKMLDPAFKTLYHYLFHPIKNAKAMKEGTKSPQEVGIRVLDDTTLCVELEKPSPFFLDLLAHWIYSPLCHTTDITQPGWAFFGAETHVCNGPFCLSKWKRNNEIEAVKNESYWNRQSIKLERIHIKIIEDQKMAWKMFSRGELDWIGEPLSPIPFSIVRRSPPEIQQHQQNAVQWVIFNTTNKLFSHTKARQAFSLGIDRQKLIDTYRLENKKPSHSPIPTSLSALEESSLTYDPEQAKQLFKEAIEELGFQPSRISLKMRVYDVDFLVLVARNIILEWETLFDIHVELEVIEWYQFFDSLSDYSYDIVLVIWYSWLNSALFTFETLLKKSNFMNLCRWEQEEFQKVVSALSNTTDENEKKQLSARAETILLKEMPIAPIFEYHAKYAKNPTLKDVSISPLGTLDFRWAQI